MKWKVGKESTYKKRSFIYVTIIIFSILILQFLLYHIQPIIDLHLPCIDYLKQGVLYDGQPQCMHGPIFYAIIAPFKLLLGESYFWAILLFNAIVFSITYNILEKILKKEKQKIKKGMLLFLFALVVVFPIVDNLGELYSLCLLVLSYYILEYKEWKYKNVFVGCAFAFLIHIKMNNLVFVAILGISHFSRKKEMSLRNLIELLVPILVITSVLVLLFPNMLGFTFFSHIFSEKESIGKVIEDAMRFLVTPSTAQGDVEKMLSYSGSKFIKTAFIDPQKIFLYILIPLISYIWWKRRKETGANLLFFGFLAVWVLSFREFDQFTLRYIFPLLPFLVLEIHKEMNVDKKWFAFFIVINLIMIFSLVQFTNNYGWYGWGQEIKDREFIQLRHDVEYPLRFIDENISLLIDDEESLVINGYDVNSSRVIQYPRELTLEERSIHPYVKSLDNLGILSEKWNKRERLGIEQTEEIMKALSKKKIDVIISMHGTHIQSLLAAIIRQVRGFKGDFSLESLGYTCSAIIPSMQSQCFGCRYQRVILFLDKNKCEEFKSRSEEYYKESLKRICLKDQFWGKLIEEMMNLGERCESKADIMIRKTGKGILNSGWDVLWLSIIGGIGLIVLRKKTELEKLL